LNEAKARMKKRFMEYAKNAEKLQKKSVENPINTYRKRSRGKVQPASSSGDSIIKNDENANKNEVKYQTVYH
jgi:hypothetical protein